MHNEQACRIILVRHGETEANVRGHFAESDEIPLTAAGRLQAQSLAARLARDLKPTVLISSTFLRARETSDILGRVLGLKAELLEEFTSVTLEACEAILIRKSPKPCRSKPFTIRTNFVCGGPREAKAWRTSDAEPLRLSKTSAFATRAARSWSCAMAP